MEQPNLTPPIGNTCPQIDDCLKNLKYVRDYINSAIKQLNEIQTDDNIKPIFDDLENGLYHLSIDGDLECLRSANGDLRSWGYELAKYIKSIE